MRAAMRVPTQCTLRESALILALLVACDPTPAREPLANGDPAAPAAKPHTPANGPSAEGLRAAPSAATRPLSAEADDAPVPQAAVPPLPLPETTATEARAAVSEAPAQRRPAETGPAAHPAGPPAMPPLVEAAATPEARPVTSPELVGELKRLVRKQEFAAALESLYEKRAWEPVFLRGLGPSTAARELVELVADLPSHAIDPKPYGLDGVDLEAVHALPEAAALEVRLTAALMRYVADFRVLRVIHPFKAVSVEGRPKFLRENRDTLAERALATLPDVRNALVALWPKRAEYGALRAALPIWRAKAAEEKQRGRPPAVPIRRMDPGDKGKDVKALQARLNFDGYATLEVTGVVDEATMEAVRTFQRRHHLVADGKPGLDTLKRFRETYATKATAIELALQRWRESEALRDDATEFIRVNIPSFTLELFENGQEVRKHRVVVGNNKLDYNLEDWRQGFINRTPLLESRLYKVILNPTWIVPARIRDAEILPETSKDPRYLSKKGIHIRTMSDGSDKFVQSAGEHNVLGQVKFLLEKSDAIYLHDTDKRKFFEKSERALSHGCMRVDKATELAYYLLETRAAKDAAAVTAILERGNTTEIPLTRSLPVYVDYVTVGVDDAGDVVFYLDVYGYDRSALQGKLPPTAYTRYGSGALRPRGVPSIPQSDYQRLRTQGPAPLVWPPGTGTAPPAEPAEGP